MRLIYLSHCLPYPPDKGDRVRAFHQIKHLAANHEIHLLALAKPGEDPAQAAALEELCTAVEVFPLSKWYGYLRCLQSLPRSEPLTLSFYRSKRLADRVLALASRGDFDALICFSSAMAPYALSVPISARLLDMVDVDSRKWSHYGEFARWPFRSVYRAEASRMQKFEKGIASGFERVVLATDRERDQLRSFAPKAKCSVVRNGVDTEFFSSRGEPEPSADQTLVFTGQMDYFANVDGICRFGKVVFPALRERFPRLRLLIVGRAPSRPVRALGESPGITVTGTVPDIRPLLAQATVFVAPLRIARGVQNKVLEAVASRRPVVCSRAVFAGLEDGGFQEGRDLCVADTREEYMATLSNLLSSTSQRSKLVDSAYRRLCASYSWTENMKEFSRLIESVVNEGRSSLPATRSTLGQ